MKNGPVGLIKPLQHNAVLRLDLKSIEMLALELRSGLFGSQKSESVSQILKHPMRFDDGFIPQELIQRGSSCSQSRRRSLNQ